MDYSLSEEQEMLRKAARDFLENECPESYVREMEEDEDGYSPKTWQKVANLGWLGLAYPEKYDGGGGSFLDLTVLTQEMGRAMFPSPYLSTVVLCGLTILDTATEEQKAELMPKIVNGKLIMALALTEPESSWDGNAWDASGIAVRAVPDGDDYVINGTKLFIQDAHIADYLLCAVRTKTTGKPEEGVTLFLVDTKSPGITCTLLRTTAGENKQSEVVFNNVRVPKKSIIGELHGGWPPLARGLQKGAVLLCAEMVGAAERLLELTTEYAKTRVQFEQPIGVNQYVQEHCVYLLSEVDGSKWVTYQAAWKISEGLPHDLEVAIAKAWTSESFERACWRAHQVHAGVGFTIDAGVLPLYSRRGKVQQIYLGDASHHLRKIAEQIEKWSVPDKPRGKPLSIWDKPEEDQVPAWKPWRERWEAIQARKVERRKRKAASA